MKTTKNNGISDMWFLRAGNIHKTCIFIYLISPLLALTVMLAKGSDVDLSTVLVVSLFLIPAGIHYLALWGLKKEKTWARVLSICIGIILLPVVPIGTIAGAILLFQMSPKDWKNRI